MKANTETNPQLATKFQVSAIPLLLIFCDEKRDRRYKGATDQAPLRSDLTALT